MFKDKRILSVLACLASAPLVSGALTVTSTTLLRADQGAGFADIDLTDGSAAASGTITPGGLTLGDGTVEEYLFVNESGGSLSIYASSTSSITTPTAAAGTISNSTESFASLTLPDGTTSFTADTTAQASDVSFTVDTSAYTSGTVYVVFGTFADFAQVSVTDGTNTLTSGFLGNTDSNAPFDTTGTAFDFSGTALATTGTAIAAFEFDNASATGTSLDFRQINTDLDGSRARFYGVIVDGVVPEPSSTALLGLGALGLIIRRRR